MTRTAGVWHTGCFKRNYTKAELNNMCAELGFKGKNATQLTPESKDILTAARPSLNAFDVVWIRKQQSKKLNFGIRTGNDPYVTFVPDEKCFRLFLACL